MKLLSFLLIIVTITTFSACDGRDRMHMSAQEVLQENQLLDSFSENITYIPETYSEVVTDTLLSNGFRIKIKTYTDMQNGIIDSVMVKDAITTKTIKREFLSEVTVFKDNKEIFVKTINKTLFSDIDDYHEAILKDMTLANVWVNQFPIADQDVAQIEIDYYRNPNTYKQNPETTNMKYGLIVYADGNFEIKSM